MKCFLCAIGITISFWSSHVFSQIEISVQCENCTSMVSIAREQAAIYALDTGDKVNVINMENGVLNSFSVNKERNASTGQFAYSAVFTNTTVELELAFYDAISKISETIHSLKSPESDINISTVNNPCAGRGQKADSVWDLVACRPAVSKLTDRVVNGEFKTLGASLTSKLLNLTNTAGIPVITTKRFIDFDTSDGGKLVFKLTYTAFNNDSVSVNAEFDYASSRDSEGNPLDASSLKAGVASGGGTYFTDSGTAGIATLQSFLHAVVRMGYELQTTNPTVGEMGCILSADDIKLVCTLL